MLWRWSFGHTNISAMICFSGHQIIRSLSNKDGHVNENDKKVVGLDWQNNNSARASRFFVHFFAVTAQLRRENAQ